MESGPPLLYRVNVLIKLNDTRQLEALLFQLTHFHIFYNGLQVKE